MAPGRGPDFSAALVPPRRAASNGARYAAMVFSPETQSKKLGPMTLRLLSDGEPLAPETYAKSGSYDFVRDVPACFLRYERCCQSLLASIVLAQSETDGADLGAVGIGWPRSKRKQ